MTDATRIYLRGDRRVHLLRILKPDTHYSEGACYGQHVDLEWT